jgi:LPXTG-site transpeptidase (sortase) family protein
MQVLRTTVTRPRRFTRDPRLILKAGSWRPHEGRRRSKLLASRRQTVAYLLIMAGTVLCTGVLGTYTWMYLKQRALLKQWNTEPATRQSLTKLSIPRIKLEDVVLEGVDAHALMLGPGHMENSVEPGNLGNSVIAGHRDTFFRRIHSLRYGDDVYVLRDGHQFHYIVRSRKIVAPTDLSVLRPSGDAELTLITCYPTHGIGPARHRLIVVAKLAASGT